MNINPVNLTLDTNMDADDFGHRFVECVEELNPDDKSFVNILKVDFGENHLPYESLHATMQFLSDALKDKGVNNTILIAIGEQAGIKDITVEKIEIENK